MCTTAAVATLGVAACSPSPSLCAVAGGGYIGSGAVGRSWIHGAVAGVGVGLVCMRGDQLGIQRGFDGQLCAHEAKTKTGFRISTKPGSLLQDIMSDVGTSGNTSLAKKYVSRLVQMTFSCGQQYITGNAVLEIGNFLHQASFMKM